jgi:transcriptional regulator with XRE-family HTH domain
MIILPKQSRAARGLLNWTLADLAGASSLGLSTVKNFENALRDTTPANSIAIRRALEDAGVEFIPAKNGKGVGVRLSVRRAARHAAQSIGNGMIGSPTISSSQT